MQLIGGWFYLLFVCFGALAGYTLFMQYRVSQYRKEVCGLRSRLEQLENRCSFRGTNTITQTVSLSCPNCGKPRKADDQRCPYCHEPT